MLFRSSAVVVCAAVLFLAACDNFINLEQIEFITYPGSDNEILSEEQTPLSLRFNTAMDTLGTQKIISVQNSGASVKGDIFWQGDELFFAPLEPWLPGVRYVLNLDGTLYAKDGREARISRRISFYSVTRKAAPYVLDFSPPDGSSTGVNAGDGAFVRVVFSAPMDSQSAIDAFTVDGISDRDFSWREDDTVLEFHPKINLDPWTVYRWNISTKAKGKNGVPLGREAGASFITDADRKRPFVKEVFPLVSGGASSGVWWARTGSPIENGLGSGQAIGVEFSKPMNESALRSIRFDPPLSGRTERWKDDTLVFIPDRDPEIATRYTLYVSADAMDSGGLTMEKEFALSFAADIPWLSVLTLDAGFGVTNPEHNGTYRARSIPPEGITTFTLRFSHAMDVHSQTAAILALRLEPFFPGTLKPIQFRSARWWSADTVVLQWEGTEQSTASEKHFYRLVLPGGRSGISDGKGSYLKEDTIFYFEMETGGLP